MTNPSFKFLTPKNNVTTPTLAGAIGASDVTIALTAGQGANFPSVSRATASSTGDARTLNSTGNLAGVALGQWLYNLTDGSWAVCTATGTNSITTTPLEGGTLNVWTNGDVVVLSGLCVATITQFNATTGAIVKQERILITNRSTDTLTAVRGLDGDTGLAFNAGDSVQILLEEHQIENIHYALRNILGKIDAIHRGVPWYALTTGSANAYAATLTPAVTDYASIVGLPIILKANFSNTGSATVNINGLGAKTLKKWSSGASQNLAANDFVTDQIAIVIYDGTNMQFIGLPVPTAATGSLFLGTVSGTNTLTGGTTPATTSYTDGQQVSFITAGMNTGAVTLNIDSVGAKSLVNYKGNALNAGDLKSGQLVECIYSSSANKFIMSSPIATGSGSEILFVTGAASSDNDSGSWTSFGYTMSIPTNSVLANDLFTFEAYWTTGGGTRNWAMSVDGTRRTQLSGNSGFLYWTLSIRATGAASSSIACAMLNYSTLSYTTESFNVDTTQQIDLDAQAIQTAGAEATSRLEFGILMRHRTL